MARSEVSYEMKLDLKNVQNPSKVKEEVGLLLIDEILRYTADGKSPVGGYGSFKSLSSDYAEDEKQGDRTPNLRLEGDMMEALTWWPTKGGVKVGIKGKEAPKADGHNNHSGDSKLPLRRFIPVEGETFKREIVAGVKEIVEESKAPTVERQLTEALLAQSNRITAERLIERDIINELLGDNED